MPHRPIFSLVLCCVLLSAVFFSGCGVKVAQLPQVAYPYVSQLEFLRHVKNVNGRAKKKYFKFNRITSPFYFLLKINDIEDEGVITVRFYRVHDQQPTAPSQGEKKEGAQPPKTQPTKSQTTKTQPTQSPKEQPTQSLASLVTRRSFNYGKPGKYYEYVIFFDRIDGLAPGTYRCAIFHNKALLYDEAFLIREPIKE